MGDAPTLAPGTELADGLVLRRFVARGAMGDVYEAWDGRLERRVAIKVLRASALADATTPTLRALREGRATARVVHPHVAALYRVARHGDQPVLVLEWVPGPTLREVLARGPVPQATALRWLSETAAAVEAAHAAGVIHCDLKPENILISPDAGPQGRVRVVDFGVARAAGPGEVLRHGTVAYLPPEALAAAPSAALDRYALAVIACELLGGARPQPRAGAMRLPAALPPPCAPLLHQALAADPSLRPASALGWVTALQRVCGEADEAVRSPTAAPPAVTPAQGPLQRRQCLQAAFATVPCIDLTTLARALAPWGPAEDPAGVWVAAEVEALRDGGWLHGPDAALQARAPALADQARQQLVATQRAALAGRLADAFAHGGHGAAPWAEQALVAAWLQGGAPAKAAAWLAARAQACSAPRGRDRLLQRALALLAGGGDPPQQLDLLLQRAALAVDAGWADVAREALAEARWHAVSQERGPADPVVLRLRATEARLWWWEGDLAAAAGAFAFVLGCAAASDEPAQPADAALMVCVAAWAIVVRLLSGEASDAAHAVDVAELATLGRRADALPGDADGLRARAEVAIAAALLRFAGDRPAAACAALRRATAHQLEAGDMLGAAGTLVLRADLARGHDRLQRDEALGEAEGLLSQLGATRPAVAAARLRAELALEAHDAFAAQRHAAVALAWAEGLAAPHESVLAALLAQRAAEALGDGAGVWQARQAEANARRALRRGARR